MSSAVYDELMLSDKPCPLINCKGHRTSEKIFLRWNDKIIVRGKAIHHHWADQNSYERWSLPQRKPALHHPPDRGCDPLFSRASRASALDAICTHSAELGFCHEFEPDLSIVCHFIYSSRLKSAVALVTADVLLRTAEPTVSQFFTRNQCYCPYASSANLRGLS